jgi:hypothetical protein
MKANETRRTSAAMESPDPAGALEAVGALMAERHRFEGWIEALNARRATTPQHVFERVHLDYTKRLDAVINDLTSHADALRRAMDELTTQIRNLTADQQRAEDERAEAELRAHVGEVSAGDWASTAAASDAAIGQLVDRRKESELELSRIRELLDSASRPPTPAASSPPVVAAPAPALAPPAPAPRASVPVARVSKAVATEEVLLDGPPPRASVGARVSVQGTAVANQPSLPAELPPAVIAAEQRLLDIEERQSMAAAQPLPSAPPAPRKSNGFDELAFLSSVVDTPAGTYEPGPTDMPDEKARRDTFAMRSQEDSIANLGSRTPLDVASIEREGPPPSSGGPPTSAIHRDTSGEGVKSLKCGECGALNYPTEWYCERCGAELASL